MGDEASDGTSLADVLAVLAALADAGCRVWVEGGWGVDALAGRQTRPHRDLDLAFDASQEPTVLAVLGELGYRPELDLRPVRMELLASHGARVDVHPLVLDAEGNGVQAGWDGASYVYPRDGFTEGTLAGRPVPCLSVAQQIAFHAGYEPRDIDRHDRATLDRLRAVAPPEEEHMHDKVNLTEKLSTFTEHWRPRIVATYNDNKVVVVKVLGEFVWHSHPGTDDLFLVLDGCLTIRLRDREVELGPGELFVVPAGVEHCPFAAEEAHVLLIEPMGTVNTGDAGGPLTAEPVEI